MYLLAGMIATLSLLSGPQRSNNFTMNLGVWLRLNMRAQSVPTGVIRTMNVAIFPKKKIGDLVWSYEHGKANHIASLKDPDGERAYKYDKAGASLKSI